MEAQSDPALPHPGDHHTIYDLLKNMLVCCFSDLKVLHETIHEMIKAAYHEDLQDILLDHLHKGRVQESRLLKIMERFNVQPSEENGADSLALVNSINKCFGVFEEGSARDAALIVNLKKADYLQLAAFESLADLCEVMGYFKMAEDFRESCKEEQEYLAKLTALEPQIFGDAYQNSVFQELDGDE